MWLRAGGGHGYGEGSSISEASNEEPKRAPGKPREPPQGTLGRLTRVCRHELPQGSKRKRRGLERDRRHASLASLPPSTTLDSLRSSSKRRSRCWTTSSRRRLSSARRNRRCRPFLPQTLFLTPSPFSPMTSTASTAATRVQRWFLWRRSRRAAKQRSPAGPRRCRRRCPPSTLPAGLLPRGQARVP